MVSGQLTSPESELLSDGKILSLLSLNCSDCNGKIRFIQSEGLPYGWECCVDPHYGTYYIDHVNKRTQLENPVHSGALLSPTAVQISPESPAVQAAPLPTAAVSSTTPATVVATSEAEPSWTGKRAAPRKPLSSSPGKATISVGRQEPRPNSANSLQLSYASDTLGTLDSQGSGTLSSNRSGSNMSGGSDSTVLTQIPNSQASTMANQRAATTGKPPIPPPMPAPSRPTLAASSSSSRGRHATEGSPLGGAATSTKARPSVSSLQSNNLSPKRPAPSIPSGGQTRPPLISNPDELAGEWIETALRKGDNGFGFTLVGGSADSRDLMQIKSVVPDGPADADGRMASGDILAFVNDHCVLGRTYHEVVALLQRIAPGEPVRLRLCRGYALPFDPDDPSTEIITTVAVSCSSQPLAKQPSPAPATSSSSSTATAATAIINGMGEAVGSEGDGGPALRDKFEINLVDVVKGEHGFGFKIADGGKYGQRVKTILDQERCKQLVEGDVILAVNHDDCRHCSHEQLVRILQQCPVNQSVEFLVQRHKLPALPSSGALNDDGALVKGPTSKSTGHLNSEPTSADLGGDSTDSVAVDNPKIDEDWYKTLPRRRSRPGSQSNSSQPSPSITNTLFNGAGEQRPSVSSAKVAVVDSTPAPTWSNQKLTDSAIGLTTEDDDSQSPPEGSPTRPAPSTSQPTTTTANGHDTDNGVAAIQAADRQYQMMLKRSFTPGPELAKQRTEAYLAELAGTQQYPLPSPAAGLFRHAKPLSSTGLVQTPATSAQPPPSAEWHGGDLRQLQRAPAMVGAHPNLALSNGVAVPLQQLKPSRSAVNLYATAAPASRFDGVPHPYPAASNALPFAGTAVVPQRPPVGYRSPLVDQTSHGNYAYVSGDGSTMIPASGYVGPAESPAAAAASVGYPRSMSYWELPENRGQPAAVASSGPYSTTLASVAYQRARPAQRPMLSHYSTSALLPDGAATVSQLVKHSPYYATPPSASAVDLNTTQTGRFRRTAIPMQTALTGAATTSPPAGRQHNQAHVGPPAAGRPTDWSYDKLTATAAAAYASGLAPSTVLVQPRFLDHQITLRHLDSGFGFRVVGGIEEGSQPCVGLIVPDGSADRDGRLLVADEIIEIDGQPTVGVSHADVIQLISAATRRGYLSLVVRRWLPPSGPQLQQLQQLQQQLGASESLQQGPVPVVSAPLARPSNGSSDYGGSTSDLGSGASFPVNGQPLPQRLLPTMESPYGGQPQTSATSSPSMGTPASPLAQVTLTRQTVNEGFGFVIVTPMTTGSKTGAGSEPAVAAHLSIGRIVRGSPAERSSLRVGDRILAVNGYDVSSMKHADVVDMVRHCGLQVTLLTLPASGTTTPVGESPQQTVGSVELVVQLARGSRGFGFSIRGGAEFEMPLKILRIAEGGPADLDGRLAVGDQLFSINGFSCDGLYHKQAIDLIQNSSNVVTLHVAKVAPSAESSVRSDAASTSSYPAYPATSAPAGLAQPAPVQPPVQLPAQLPVQPLAQPPPQPPPPVVAGAFPAGAPFTVLRPVVPNGPGRPY